MNLEVLNYVVENAVERIEDLAEENGLDPSASVGVAKFLIGHNGDLSSLSSKQMFHYEHAIEPLIERVPCEGVIGYVEEGDTCNGDGYIDDETLIFCYIDDDFKCQICRHDAEKMQED